MLSFTLSGKHIAYTYTHALYNKHITVTYIRICMNSYRKRIHILVLIAELNLSRSPVGVIDLYLYGGTRRYYKAYTCAEVPVGTTKLVL